MKEAPNRRQSLVSNPELQRRMTMAISWPIVLLIAANGGTMSVLMFHATSRELDWLYVPLITALALLLIAGGFFLVNTVKVSNQILGPLVRIHRVLTERKAGGTGHIKLRDGDYLTELAVEINDLLDWVDAQVPPTEEGEDIGEPADGSELARALADETVEAT